MHPVTSFQAFMAHAGISHFLIPTADPHFSEYLPAYWQTRSWLSGFDGSAGTLLVGREKAWLWVDSRYHLQAEKQCAGSPIKVMKLGNKGVPKLLDWLEANKDSINCLALDPQIISRQMFKQLSRILPEKVRMEEALLSDYWVERPKLEAHPIQALPDSISGQAVDEKLASIRAELEAQNADLFILTALDEIAWVFNLRGQDIPCNPVFYAFAVIDNQAQRLFLRGEYVTSNVVEYLKEYDIIIDSYDSFYEFLAAYKGQKILYSGTLNHKIAAVLEPKNALELSKKIAWQKATRNEVQIERTKEAMLKDGVALIRAFRWLEQQLAENKTVSEYDFGQQLDICRAEQADYYGKSFAPIVGFNENGAIVHYSASASNCLQIEGEGLLLVDSGGQYLQGTTDITRTIWIGSQPETEIKACYTMVLKGHLALANCIFPQGTAGIQLDILARQFLWEQGLNYGHGTGHGVGHFLNVHEGPHGISGAKSEYSTHKIPPYSLTSNEPGYYKTGSFGVRIENLELCVPTEKEGFWRFETLTLFPYDRSLIDASQLDSKEIAQIDAYHQKVYEALAPLISEKEQKWLATKCEPLKVVKTVF